MHGETEANFSDETVHFGEVRGLLCGGWRVAYGCDGERRRDRSSGL